MIANGPGQLDSGADVILFPSRWDSAVQAAPFRFYPYELAYLSTLLKRELPGANVTMLDGNLHQRSGDQYIQEISTPQPGTPFYAQAKASGWLLTEDLNYFNGWHAVLSYPDYPADRIMAVRMVAP